jgi:hypothetical protein
MKIILHILVKDLRRQWIEISLFVLVCIAWVWQTAHPSSWEWFRQRELVPVLLFGMWFLVVIRAVQGECLVGDREFWMTRPYRWPQLMVAKALFLALCLNLPLFIAQLFLLSAAQIPLSWSLLPGLLFLGLEFAFFLTFPAAALAAVTQSVVQWGLALVGMLVYTLMLSWLPWNKLPDGLEGGQNLCASLDMALIAPALAFILLWQYARRRVRPPRLVFAGILLTIPLIILLASSPFIRSIAYPQAKGSPPLRISIAENNGDPTRTYTRSGGFDGAASEISIPVSAAPADSDTIVNVDGLRVTLVADNGWRWQSPWQSRSVRFSKNSPNGSLSFSMPEDQAIQMAKLHVKASVELAFTVYRLGAPHRVDTRADRFQLSGNTYCSWHRQDFSFFNGVETRGLDCEAALHLPVIMQIQMESGSGSCSQPPDQPPIPAGHYAADIEYGTDLPADFDPNPAHKVRLFFGSWIPPIPNPRDPKDNLTAWPCRGVPLEVRTGLFENRVRASFDLGFIGSEEPISPESKYIFDSE